MDSSIPAGASRSLKGMSESSLLINFLRKCNMYAHLRRLCTYIHTFTRRTFIPSIILHVPIICVYVCAIVRMCTCMIAFSFIHIGRISGSPFLVYRVKLNHFYVKSIDSNSSGIEAARTECSAWTVCVEELNQLEPTRAFSWRLEGCSDAIRSSLVYSGHGKSSNFRSNRRLVQQSSSSLPFNCEFKAIALINPAARLCI